MNNNIAEHTYFTTWSAKRFSYRLFN